MTARLESNPISKTMQCGECYEEFAANTSRCPNCGESNKNRKAVLAGALFAGLALVVAILALRLLD